MGVAPEGVWHLGLALPGFAPPFKCTPVSLVFRRIFFDGGGRGPQRPRVGVAAALLEVLTIRGQRNCTIPSDFLPNEG